MREDRWDRKLYSGTELYGKTLAILGLGRIGREVAIRMKTWGMDVIGYDPITTEAEAKAAGIKKMELADIWPLADYITVHVPLIPSTRSKIYFKILKSKTFQKYVSIRQIHTMHIKKLLKKLEFKNTCPNL